jgi:hypothetical protein
MPRYDVDRDGFLGRIERRRRWAYRRFRVRRLLGSPPPLQALVYDATFRSDAEAVTYHYAKVNDHMPDFDTPAWVNEKIRWQFLNHPNPLMSLAADKIAVRDYLRLKGAVVQPPALIACGSDPAALEFAELPERFALKAAFGSGQNHLQTPENALSRRELVAKAAAWMQWDQWRHTGELHYRGVPKRWLVEELMPAARERLEFKFFCMQGEPVFVTVITERSAAGYRRAVFDLDWNRLDIRIPGVAADSRPLARPPDLHLMIAEARRLSEDFLHVRVDFLKFDGRLVFSELTFANLAAAVPFAPVWMNRELGALMDLRRAPAHLERGHRIAAHLRWRSAA